MCCRGRGATTPSEEGGSGWWGSAGRRPGEGSCDQEGPRGAEDGGDPAEQAGLMPELSRAKVLNWLLRVECLKQFTSGANCSWIIFP